MTSPFSHLVAHIVVRVVARLVARLVGRGIIAVALIFAISTVPRAQAQPEPPLAYTYSAGARTIEQTWLPRRDPARVMPYRVEGIIAVPPGDGPFPLVLIFHDAHGGCPADPTVTDVMLERWPCSPAEERRNDVGLAYLARALAARGYVAVAPNLNAVYAAYGTVGPETQRYPEVLNAHLSVLVEANRRESPALEVSLVGKLDLARIGIIAHGHGALLAMQSARARQGRPRPKTNAAGGPLSAVLLIAPLYSPEGDADAPLGIVLPSCDGITPELSGQGYYEDARLARNRNHFAASVYLIGANHNAFNEVARTDDAGALPPASGCRANDRRTLRLAPQQQREFLARYAPDFLDVAMSTPAALQGAPATRAGLNPAEPAPASLYGFPTRTALSLGIAGRGIVIQPRTRDDLGYNDFGGYATGSGATHLGFCAYRQPCMRWAIQPGNPAQVRFSWNHPAEARWTLPLGESTADLSEFRSLHLRVVPDPTDYLNAHREPIAIVLTLTDGADRSASIRLDGANAPALAYPPGEPDKQTWGWVGHAYLGSVRVGLAEFGGVDLTRAKSLEIGIAGTRSGSLLIADIEFLRTSAAPRSSRLGAHHATPQ